MKYRYQKNKERIELFKSNKMGVVWFLAVILLTLNVFFAVQLSSYGARIALYEKETQEMGMRNENLSTELLRLTSLTKLGKVSGNMGFTRIENTLYLKPEDSFAKAK